nr:hypothetical protein [uncultured Lichenicoccus sp.]
MSLRIGRRSIARLASCVAAWSLLAAPALTAPALAASQCGMSPAREAFDVQGLKSELMVTALSCGEQDRYNAFVAKFKPGLNDEEEALRRYFASSYGRTAQREHDDYITQLANVQSERGLAAGTSFCQQRVSMFDEVQALDTTADLGGYAEAKDIVQPATYETCAAPAPVEHPGRVRHIRSTRHHKA